MNILITGGGFIAESLRLLFLKENCNVCVPFHKDLDVSSFDQVKTYLKNNNFEIIIHAAIKGGRKYLKQNTIQDFYENILMLENLLFFRNNYKRLIYFGSGAEFDQRIDILNVKEEEYFSIPTDFYGLSKYNNVQRLKKENKAIVLRLFNCFGPLEKRRFINYAIDYYINKKQIEIWHDIYLDFFYIDDLFSVIKYVIKNNDIKELNCCYKEKYKMSEVVEIINNLNNYKVPVIINSETGKNYCGNGDKLDLIKEIKLKGLKQGIIETYNKIKKNNE